MFGLKTTELVIIFLVILILFGGSRIAGLGKALGTGIRNFKKGISEDDDETVVAESSDVASKTTTSKAETKA